MGLVSISPILAAQDMGVPIVIRVPDYWLVQLRTELCEESNPIKRWYRAVFSGLGGFNRLDTRHLIMYNQEFMQSYLQAGFPRESMHVIPIGLPLDLILDNNELSCFPLADQNGDFRLLYAGRLNSSKAPDVAIQALSFITGEMGIRRARLDIIGEGPEDFERKLRDLVTRLGLGERVSFVGKVDFPKLLELYTQYNALLFPSRWIEPFGRSVIEAMARGLPVVATNHGGPAEIISDGENGLLVPPDNPVAMAEAVKKLLLTPELTQRIRCNALATIRAKYSLESIVEQLEAYLETRKRAPLSV
jgi:glycosyltransferase involved in cell wall biosynthesis